MSDQRPARSGPSCRTQFLTALTLLVVVLAFIFGAAFGVDPTDPEAFQLPRVVVQRILADAAACRT